MLKTSIKTLCGILYRETDVFVNTNSGSQEMIATEGSQIALSVGSALSTMLVFLQIQSWESPWLNRLWMFFQTKLTFLAIQYIHSYGNSLQGHWKFISSTVKFQFHSFFHVQRCRDAFGCMKLKFGRLEKVELNKLEEICNLIMSTCVLYNFCINVNEYDEELKGKWYGPLVFPNDKI